MSKKTEAVTEWTGIKNETIKKANTATRIGNAGLKILEAVDEIDIEKKVDKVTLLSITTPPTANLANLGKEYYDSTENKLGICYLNNVTYLWNLYAVPVSGVVYLFGGSNYVWNGVKLIELGTSQTDAELSSTSTNSIQNKAVYAGLLGKVDKFNLVIADFTDLDTLSLADGIYNVSGSNSGELRIINDTGEYPSVLQIWTASNGSIQRRITPEYLTADWKPCVGLASDSRDGLLAKEYFPQLVTLTADLAAKENTGVAASLVSQLTTGATDDTFLKLQNKITAINAIIGDSAPDADNLINQVSELLPLFASMQEGLDMFTLLAAKVATNAIYNELDCIVSGKVADARTVNLLNSYIESLATGLATKAPQSTTYTKSDIDTKLAKLTKLAKAGL